MAAKTASNFNSETKLMKLLTVYYIGHTHFTNKSHPGSRALPERRYKEPYIFFEKNQIG